MKPLPNNYKRKYKKIIKKIKSAYKSIKRRIKFSKKPEKVALKAWAFLKSRTNYMPNLINKIKSATQSSIKYTLLFFIIIISETYKALAKTKPAIDLVLKYIEKLAVTSKKAPLFLKFIMKSLSQLGFTLKNSLKRSFLKAITLIRSAAFFMIKSAFKISSVIKNKFFTISEIKALNKQLVKFFTTLFVRISAFIKCRAFSLIMLCAKTKRGLKSLFNRMTSPISSIKKAAIKALPSVAQRKQTAAKLRQHALLLAGVISCGILSALILSINHKKNEPVLVKGDFQQDDDLGTQAIKSAEIALSTVLGLANESTSMLSDVAMSSSSATEPQENPEADQIDVVSSINETPSLESISMQADASNPLDASEVTLTENSDVLSTLDSKASSEIPTIFNHLIAANETTSALRESTPTDESTNIQYQEQTPTLNSSVQIGGDYTYLNLKPEGSSSFGGSLGGMQGLYEYRPSKGFYTSAKFDWKEGVTSDSSGDRSILYFDTQERFGYTLSFNNTACKLTLYSGLGYRHLWQKVSPNAGTSLQFRYNEFYIPVGFASEYSLYSWVSLGLGFTWMPQVFSTVGISAIKGTCWSLTNTLPNLYVEVPFDFALTKDKKFHIIAKPFYEYWEDGDTTATTASGIPLGLPGNTYNYWGLNVNFAYNF
jgi:hypothetical protein